MNYLELINKCLVELNYKQVNTFSELTKNEHNKLKNIINIINSEICTSDKWNFLIRNKKLTLSKNSGEIENTIDGRIKDIIVDGKKYEYFANFEHFFTNSQPSSTYSLFNDKILFPTFNKDKTVEIIYYTKNCVKNQYGKEKLTFEEADDISLIPNPFVEPIVVYGACMRLKGNPKHARFSYWLSMYKDAFANLKSKVSKTVEEHPTIKISRR